MWSSDFSFDISYIVEPASSHRILVLISFSRADSFISAFDAHLLERGLQGEVWYAMSSGGAASFAIPLPYLETFRDGLREANATRYLNGQYYALRDHL